MSDTRRIAKNTLILYFRQILIMLVSLYTVRVVLSVLGAEDYGIYNVVAGVTVLFSFVNNAMATSTQRFLNYSLGEGNLGKVNEVYSASLIIHGGIAVLFLVLAETIGLWFVAHKISIPKERHTAALIVYQFSIIATVFTILRVPYNAVIIAYERMSFFAGLSIMEAVMKLLVLFLLSVVRIDKLIFYSFLLVIVAVFITMVYKIYCNTTIETARFSKVSDRSLVKELFSFSGWNLFGATANVANQQGANIVLNIFTNVTMNAAMGISNQVNSAVYSFVSNFQTAFNPQLVKSWAARDFEFFHSLLLRASKISFYLLFLVALPLYLNADFVLSVWLKNVPEYAVQFVRLILIWSLIETVNGPLYMAIQATGHIKLYQILIGILNFLNLPFAIFAFYCGASAVWVLYIRIILNSFALFFRLWMCKGMIQLPVHRFVLEVIIKSLFITFISAFMTMYVGRFVHPPAFRLFSTTVVSICATLLLVLCFGFSIAERKSVLSTLLARRICEK